MSIFYKIKLKYLKLKQWFIAKIKKDDDDNIYPMW